MAAPFILYNTARLYSLQRKFQDKVKAGELEPLPTLDAVDTAAIDADSEWRIFLEFVVSFASVIKTAALPKLPVPPGLPDYLTHRIADFLNCFTRELSSYYGPSGVRILPSASAC